MEIVVSEHCCFCFGVENAINRAEEVLSSSKPPFYLVGPIVHNRKVVESLIKQGFEVIDGPEGHGAGVAVIRAHGILKDEREKFLSSGFTLIDGTCPLVERNHGLAKESKLPLLLFGSATHAETKATASYANVPYEIYGSADAMPTSFPFPECNVIVQTTFSDSECSLMEARLKESGVKCHFLSKVCPSSGQRRKALMDMAGKVDAIVVVGDDGSANTMELVRISKKLSKPTFLVSDPCKIPTSLVKYGKVGVTAGASVPRTAMEEVIRRLSQL